ncbi:MAG: helix-turn-helix domain-containing protein [Candidatus Rokuibacteriota bacterium]
MFEIGNSLREARLRQGLEIPRIEADTKIRGKYLRALEEEQFDVLPGDTYVKGFLRTYADYLGLEGQLYLDEYNSRFTPAEELSPAQAAAPRRRRRVESNFVVVALAGIVAVTVLVVVGLAGIGSGSDDDPPVAGTTTEPTTTADSPGGTTTEAGAEAPPPRARLVLTAARGDSFLQVRSGGVSGRLLWEGTLEEGQTQRFLRYRRLWLDLDDPQNLNAKLNGRRVELPSEPAVVLVSPRRVRVLATS